MVWLLLKFRAKRVVGRIIWNDLATALDTLLKLTPDIIRGRFCYGASAHKIPRTYHNHDEGRFHPGSIKKISRMAIPISPDLILNAYAEGWFPMAVETGEIRWFSPDPRGVIPLDGFCIPHGARKTLADPAWTVSVDHAFERVMRACAEREETWIDETILSLYCALHRQGVAHSVEVWRDGELAGGLYGVRLRGAFFGESMFHRVGGASKVALVALHTVLVHGGFSLLDIQWLTPHLATFGAVEIPRDDYLERLDAALQNLTCRFRSEALAEKFALRG